MVASSWLLALLLPVSIQCYTLNPGSLSSAAGVRSCSLSTACMAGQRSGQPLTKMSMSLGGEGAGQSKREEAMRLGGAGEQGKQGEGLSRRAAVVEGLLSLAIFGSFAREAQAAVPTISDYSVGSGTKIIDKDAPVYKAPPEIKVTDKEMLVIALAQAEATLKQARGYVDQSAWENVRSLLQSQQVTQKYIKPERPGVLFQKFGGLGLQPAFMEATGVDADTAKKFEKARKDASKSLLELSEFAFTNRVMFFNEEDQKKVSLLESNLEVDLDEARSFVDNALSSLSDMQECL